MEKQRSAWRAPLVILSVAVGLCLIIAAGTLSSAWLFRSSSRETERVATAFARRALKVLNLSPEIIIDRTTLLQEHAPTLELISSKHDVKHSVNWSSTWLKSTKQITVSGQLTANVGFDLKEPLRVEFDTATQTVTITHPAPRLLALEVGTLQSSEGSGWWNSVTDADRSEALSRFTADARATLLKDPALLANARIHLHSQLTGLLEKTGMKIVFHEEDSASLPSPKSPTSPASPVENATPLAESLP